MPKAVVRNGAILPLEPLPPEWHDGTEVTVEAVQVAALEEINREADEWFREMEAAVARVDPNDSILIDAAIQEADRIAKEQVRREMGLP